MDFSEPTISETTVFKGKFIELKQLSVQLPNGSIATREVVTHPGAVAILAELEPGRIVLVSQFRKAPDCVLLEVPAGKLEFGEDPKACAQRELREETGYLAQNLTLIQSFFTSPGFADEKISLYYATGLTQGTMDLDEDEFVEMKLYTRDEVKTLLPSQQIQDAKTLVALQWWLMQGDDK